MNSFSYVAALLRSPLSPAACVYPLSLTRVVMRRSDPLRSTQQAANYMDIKPLLDLTCAKVASMIKGMKHAPFLVALPLRASSLTLTRDLLYTAHRQNPGADP